jgi:peptide/nickel transport system ATP-binding protein
MDTPIDTLLEVKGLKTYFFMDEGTVKAVEEADFTIRRGQTVGVVGESGCGKSVTAFSILQLVEKPGKIVSGQILLHRRDGEIVDLAKLHPRGREIRRVRGGDISMIFQEPMVSLSMMHTIGDQISEAILLHQDVSKADARRLAIEMLGKVGIPKPEERVDAYPFQLSGGMRQRAMIAMALVCNPALLIADEPTTALDVTTQAQILELMNSLKKEFGMAVMIITHNLGVVAETCQEVIVMYLGEIVEQSPVNQLFHDPLHPYTQALLKSIPVLGRSKQFKLDPISGAVPDPYNRPSGCPFHPRCVKMQPGVCDVTRPALTKLPDGRTVRCVLYPSPSGKGG